MQNHMTCNWRQELSFGFSLDTQQAQLHRRQIRLGGPLAQLALLAEVGAMAGAIERLLQRVKLQDALLRSATHR